MREETVLDEEFIACNECGHIKEINVACECPCHEVPSSLPSPPAASEPEKEKEMTNPPEQDTKQ